LSLVLSTFHFTPAQANGGPIGNRDCDTGLLVGEPTDGIDSDPLTYFVELDGTYTLSGGVGCEGPVTIAPGVTTIGSFAFFMNAALTSVTIPNSVTTIGNNAFDSTSLASVTFGNSVTTIGVGAFYYNIYLTSVAIPNSVTTIGANAFNSSTSLATLTIGNSVTTIGDGAFSNTGLTNVTIPNSVITIGASAFNSTSSLTSVTIGNSVTTIGDGAFSSTGLTNVTIPNSVITIGTSAFASTYSLTSVTIGNSVTSIGNNAFFGNAALASVTIGNSVTTIGESAFYENFSLVSVTIPNSVTTIGAYAFSNTGLTSITIPNSVTSIGDYAFGDIPAFILSSSSEIVPINTSATGFTITNLSAPATAFSITPTPPEMIFDTETGELTGTPSTAASATAYTVTATNDIYSASTIFTLTVLGPATAPAAPTLNSVTGGNKQLTIEFTPGDDGGAAITDYEYSLNGGAYISAGTASSPFTISSLSGRTAYSVTIKAKNSVGLSTASSSLSATTTDSSLDANEAANAEAARVAAAAEAARVAAANAEAARKAKEQQELTEILALIPSIGELTLSFGEITKSLYSTKCVKGKTVKYVNKGSKCPKGYVKKK